MPTIKRDAFFQAAMVEAFHENGLWGKITQVATIFVTMVGFVIPQELSVALGLAEPRRNMGRLTTVVKNQIYQQLFMSGYTQSTIFKSRQGDALLIYIPPKMTAEFRADVAQLGVPVKYIIAANECHESYAEDCKKAYPEAKVLTPKPSRKLVEEAVAVDATIEESLQMLETEFGFTKMFRYDHNSRCTAERSYQVEIFDTSSSGDKDTSAKSYCLFVGQCGMGNYSILAPSTLVAGFQSLFQPRGRVFRHYLHCFTKDKSAVRPYWTHMVQSIPDSLDAAVFIHGDPVMGTQVREQLLQFYAY
ncbi:expressed unknown protein [Seminavis robusta]|uniref:Uncharacterized protein n=1 Tax=Seminavis robusta TaxID=568900 RepID=A0A9N8HAF0_9STRA|nr:expressed unknown protein [Seminavis robusta]|eukprot:Sro318_g115840.1 n/a (304) ;mRNA; f:2001-2912